jgi:hypothetical protein
VLASIQPASPGIGPSACVFCSRSPALNFEFPLGAAGLVFLALNFSHTETPRILVPAPHLLVVLTLLVRFLLWPGSSFGSACALGHDFTGTVMS